MTATPHPSVPHTARWRKSSYSNGFGGECVEIAPLSGRITAIRDSKDPSGPHLTFGADAWGAFLAAISAGEFTGS